MSDRHPAAPAILLGQVADQPDVHVMRRMARIEVDVDVDVELARQLEHAADLPGMIAVVAGCSADQAGAPLQGGDQQLVRPRIVGQAFLREDADLEVDGPA